MNVVRVALCFTLGALLLPSLMAASGAEAFKSSKAFKPETVRTLPLSIQSDGGEQLRSGVSDFSAQLLPDIPAWVSKPKTPRTILQLAYQVDRLNEQPAILVLQVESDNSALQATPTGLLLVANLDQCRLRILLDLNGDRQFDATEIQSAALTNAKNTNEPNISWSATTRFSVAQMARSDMPLQLQLKVLLRPSWSIFQTNLSMANQIRDGISLLFQLSPTLQADLTPLGSSDRLSMSLGLRGNQLSLKSSSLSRDRMASNGGCGCVGYMSAAEAELDRPLVVGGKLWMVTAVAADFTTVTIAEPEAWARDELKLTGAAAPTWSRPDLQTRHIYTPADFTQRYLILCSQSNMNFQTRYLVMQQQARLLWQFVPADQVRLILLDDNFQADNFIAQMAGVETLPFGIVADRDSSDNSGRGLKDIFRMQSGFNEVVMIGPDNKIALRERGTLAESMDKIKAMIPAGHSAIAQTTSTAKTTQPKSHHWFW